MKHNHNYHLWHWLNKMCFSLGWVQQDGDCLTPDGLIHDCKHCRYYRPHEIFKEVI